MMLVQTTLFGYKNVLHVYHCLHIPGMTVSYFCHDAKLEGGGGGGGGPRLNVIMTLIFKNSLEVSLTGMHVHFESS